MDTRVLLGVGMLLALLLGGAVLLSRGEPPIGRGPTGYDALAPALRAFDLEAVDLRSSARRDDTPLRIIPLRDTDLRRRSRDPETQEEAAAETDLADISQRVLSRKFANTETVLILPKWRRAVDLSGHADPEFLAEAADVARPLRQLGFEAELARAEGLRTLRLGQEATVYLPQHFTAWPELCAPALRDREIVLAIRCKQSPTLWIVAEPDLFNNHGLTLGDTAAVTSRFVAELADGGTVVIDRLPIEVFGRRLERDERTWEDLARYFAWPLSMLWLGGAILLALALWRGGVRVGPPVQLFAAGIGAARRTALKATARLMRAGGEDAALIRAYATHRLTRAARAVFGPHHGTRPLERLVARARDRNAQGADALAAEAAALTGESPDPARLGAFNDSLDSVLEELGRRER